MPLPPNFLDELRARTPLQALIGRSVRLSRSGRESKGCCPFHGEKTPSFYVYDDHFHCFGCGEHGDAITFVMKSQGAGFMEAVESLAAEAGLEVPKASPAEAEREAKRANIHEVLQAAAKTYQSWLFAPEGAAALNYLRQRGLTDATIKKFGLGWSGEGRGTLANALSRHGIKPDQLIEAGLMKQGDFGPVDMFFSRVMFPIQDRRGTITSFSGRILGDGTPKYVNGPETPAFSKRRSLYGVNFAREAVRKGDALIIVEGQMDVIALSQAGFGGAVAPLGTALTEEQLAEIWNLSPEPVICFDSDKAGRRAALRTVDLALVALAPDRSLKFLSLPESEDPDSLIRKEGRSGFKDRLAGAQPLSAALYDMLAAGAVGTTPEANTGFRKRLIEIADRISDKILSAEYKRMLLDRFFAEKRNQTKQKLKFIPWSQRVTIKASSSSISPARADEIRAFIMTATLIEVPAVIPGFEEAFSSLPLPESCQRIRGSLNSFLECTETLDTESLFTHLSGLGLADEARVIMAVAARHDRIPMTGKPRVVLSPSQASENLWAWHSLMRTSIESLTKQYNEEHSHFLANPMDTASQARLIKLRELMLRARAGETGAEA